MKMKRRQPAGSYMASGQPRGGWLALAVLTLVSGGGCGGEAAPSRSEAAVVRGELAEGVVAEVGPEEIADETVARIAGIEALRPDEALDWAISDALLAAAAKADLAPWQVDSAQRRALAHALLQSLWVQARQEPITEAELAEATQVRWTRYDRPEGYRTVHYVVQVDDEADDETRNEAEELAAEIREAVLALASRAREEPAPELDEDAMFRTARTHPDPVVAAWKQAVEAEEHRGMSVVAQPLPPITAEGRPIEHGVIDSGGFDENFARQVAKLENRGDMTDVFPSSAGYHVAMLLETTPPRRASRQERLEGLRDEILRVRALRRRRELLEGLRERTDVEEPSNVDALLSQVRIDLDED